MLIAVYTTLDNREAAQAIAQHLVQKKLVACAQISAIKSFYVWSGVVQQAPEWRVLLKTTDRQYDAVEAAIRELHPYELPAIYAMAVERADADYAEWVQCASSGE